MNDERGSKGLGDTSLITHTLQAQELPEWIAEVRLQAPEPCTTLLARKEVGGGNATWTLIFDSGQHPQEIESGYSAALVSQQFRIRRSKTAGIVHLEFENAEREGLIVIRPRRKGAVRISLYVSETSG